MGGGINIASPIKGLADVTGITIEDVKKKAASPGTYPVEDMNKIFFLYNVKTGQFINAGGFWGTHISVQDYPMPLWVNLNSNSTIELAQNLDTGQGHLLGWMGGTDTSKSDNGIFIDRNRYEDSHYGWTFEAKGTKNSYRIYTYATNNPTTNSYWFNSTKYYLCAKGGNVDQDKNCEGLSDTEIRNQNLSGYDEWRILSMQQIYDLQKLNSDNMTSSIDFSFMIDCPGFSRGNKDITKWKTVDLGKLKDGGVRFGLEKLYNTSAVTSSDNYEFVKLSKEKPYSFGGRTYTEKQDYQRYLAKYFCVDAKNVRGTIYQDVKVTAGGSYVIECQGYSTTPKAKIFAVLLDQDGNKVTRTVHQTVFNQVSYMPAKEQEELHISEQNMDYAGKSFYGSPKFKNSVLVQVPALKIGEYRYIRFGVFIGDDENDKTPEPGEWTVFDDFRLLYASKTIDEDLILDEDRMDLEYLKTCSNNYRNKVLHLKKTFTKDKWNSFVLPVKLTRNQFRGAFGANARLAKLSALTDTEIQFQSIDMDAMSTNDVVLEAYTPYIIFPTKQIASRESPAYRALLTETNGASKSHQVVVASNHIDIPNVTMEIDGDNKNDLRNMNTNTWTTNMMYSVSGNGTMEARGTFARTFGTEHKQDLANEDSDDYGKYIFLDRKIIPGRDDLRGSYFFDRGNLYMSNTRVRGLRGFSCWFKPVNGSQAKNLRLFIDGVANGTTGISDVVFDGEQSEGKTAQGIYNMSGQLISHSSDTAGLPAGIYIVNGKKCIVK